MFYIEALFRFRFKDDTICEFQYRLSLPIWRYILNIPSIWRWTAVLHCDADDICKFLIGWFSPETQFPGNVHLGSLSLEYRHVDIHLYPIPGLGWITAGVKQDCSEVSLACLQERFSPVRFRIRSLWCNDLCCRTGPAQAPLQILSLVLSQCPNVKSKQCDVQYWTSTCTNSLSHCMPHSMKCICNSNVFSKRCIYIF